MAYLCPHKSIITMLVFGKKSIILSLALLLTCCKNANTGSDGDVSLDEYGTAQNAAPVAVVPTGDDSGELLITNEPYCPILILDAEGNINRAARQTMSKNELITYHYQRVGCKEDTCRQEFVTYAAVQYPKDSVLQVWMADVLAKYYYDVTRELDNKVNGHQTETNEDGETLLKNVGCRPYDGILSDEGKQLFDYYQARVWVVGRDRDATEHGPEGRYGCFIYRCWQSPAIASYMVAYSTEEPQWPVHQVVSFDRKSGQQLQLTDVVREDGLAELQDLVAEAVRTRHYKLRKANDTDLDIESESTDYSVDIQSLTVGFTADGLAVSTQALPFDRLAWATHILVLPYAKVNELLVERYRR